MVFFLVSLIELVEIDVFFLSQKLKHSVSTCLDANKPISASNKTISTPLSLNVNEAIQALLKCDKSLVRRFLQKQADR